MGESKRRKTSLGDQYGKEAPIMAGLPITKKQAEQFVLWTNRGSWIGIGVMAVFWVMLHFIGPALGWWEVQ
jgi:hypothetical protein